MALTVALAVALLLLAAGLAAARAAVLKIGDSGARVLADEGFAGAEALSAVRAGSVAGSPLGPPLLTSSPFFFSSCTG